MNKKTLAILAVAAAILVTASLKTNSAAAQTGGGYDLTWNSIDGGGATLNTGGSYSLGGTIGQADAGVMSGGSYMINGGFWSRVSINYNYNVYLPLIVKND